jgi:PBSX family phage terminase large subunit
MLRVRGYQVIDHRTDNTLEVRKGNKVNFFFIFGGRDERSQDFVQGMTCAGFFFDEVALMPQSFVNQAIGRCSVEGSKWWFNCNPDKPDHWFNIEWILKAKEKGLYCLHFELDDNPSLSEAMKKRYRAMFTGVFFLRYILGLWVLAEGVIYDMVDDSNYYDDGTLALDTLWQCQRYIVIDYGTTNPMVYLDIYDTGKISYIDNEYYWDSAKEGRQKTDSIYADDLLEFIAKSNVPITRVIHDPSAASFRAELRSRGLMPKDANNDVIEGIRLTSSAFQQKLIMINRRCKHTKAELGGYCWDAKAKDRGVEQPMKINDHACIVGETLIETTKGKKQIKDLVNTTGSTYCINTKTKRKAIGSFSNVRCTGNDKECIRINLSNGSHIDLTEDHKVLTNKGWRYAKDLTINDKVVKINYVK